MRCWVCLVVVILICMPLALAATEGSANPFLDVITDSGDGASTQQKTQAAAIILPDILEMEARLAEGLQFYQDENFRLLDARLVLFLKDFRTKTLAGIVGLQLLIAGIIFYIINRNQRQTSYESVSLRKRQGDEDRVHLVEALNSIRAKVDFLEQEAKRQEDTRVIPTKVLDEYGGAQNGGGNEHQPDQTGGNAVEEGGPYYGPDPYYDPEQQQYGPAPGEGGYPPEEFI